MDPWSLVTLSASTIGGLMPAGGWLLLLVVLATGGVAVGALVRHAPPRVRWLLMPGLLLSGVLGATSVITRWDQGPVRRLEHGLMAAMMMIVSAGVVWVLTPAVVAPAVALRPGDETRRTPGPAMAEVVTVWLASLVPFVLDQLAPAPLWWWLAALPAPVVVLAIRTSPSLRQARQDAALVQVAGVACCAAGYVAAAWARSYRWEQMFPSADLVDMAALALPTLALSAVGFAHAGLPARRRLLLAVFGPPLLAIVLLAAWFWLQTRPDRQLAGMDLTLPVADGGGRRLPIDACWVRPGEPPCRSGSTVLIAGPDDPIAAVAVFDPPPAWVHPSIGPDPRWIAYRAGDRFRALPLSEGTGAATARITLGRAGSGFRVADRVVDDLEAATSALRGAREACPMAHPSLRPSDGWTAAEVVGFCADHWCVIDETPPANLPDCRWRDGAWVIGCPAGTSCEGAPGLTVLCLGWGCTLTGSGRRGEPVRLWCPDGGCQIRLDGGPAEIACPKTCTVRGDRREMTCLEGDCR